jgi:hypothetical protein
MKHRFCFRGTRPAVRPASVVVVHPKNCVAPSAEEDHNAPNAVASVVARIVSPADPCNVIAAEGGGETITRKELKDLAAEINLLAGDHAQIRSHTCTVEVGKVRSEIASVWFCAVHPDGLSFCYGSEKSRLVFVGVPSFAVLHEVEAPFPWGLTYSPDGKHVLFAGGCHQCGQCVVCVIIVNRQVL